MADELMTMSKAELRETAGELMRRQRSARLRERVRSADAAELTGFVGGAVGLGYLSEKGFLPEKIGGIDTELLVGGVALVAARGKTSKRAAMLRGLGYAALSGGLKDMGRRFAQGG